MLWGERRMHVKNWAFVWVQAGHESQDQLKMWIWTPARESAAGPVDMFLHILAKLIQNFLTASSTSQFVEKFGDQFNSLSVIEIKFNHFHVCCYSSLWSGLEQPDSQFTSQMYLLYIWNWSHPSQWQPSNSCGGGLCCWLLCCWYHVSLLWLAICLSNYVQRQFCLTCPLTWNTYATANSQFWVVNLFQALFLCSVTKIFLPAQFPAQPFHVCHRRAVCSQNTTILNKSRTPHIIAIFRPSVSTQTPVEQPGRIS